MHLEAMQWGTQVLKLLLATPGHWPVAEETPSVFRPKQEPAVTQG